MYFTSSILKHLYSVILHNSIHASDQWTRLKNRLKRLICENYLNLNSPIELYISSRTFHADLFKEVVEEKQLLPGRPLFRVSSESFVDSLVSSDGFWKIVCKSDLILPSGFYFNIVNIIIKCSHMILFPFIPFIYVLLVLIEKNYISTFKKPQF